MLSSEFHYQVMAYLRSVKILILILINKDFWTFVMVTILNLRNNLPCSWYSNTSNKIYHPIYKDALHLVLV